MTVPTDPRYAAGLDAQDPLRHFRRRFAVPDPSLVYLDGNSLGRPPLVAADLAQDLVNVQWGDRLIRAWNEGWYTAPERLGAKLARLIGAQADEVIIADSTSVNLFKLVVAALQFQANRTHILTDDLNFPSDLYILQGAIGLLDRQHQLKPIRSADGIHGPERQLRNCLDHNTALLTLSHVAFKSGFLYDVAQLTAAAHQMGALVLWDLSHSVGAVPIDLNGWQVDLAVGCTYKYLNGGPGAPAFIYIRRDLQDRLHNPISGWMGQQAPFDFALRYEPAKGLRRFLSGTPTMASLSLMEPGLDLLLEAGIDQVRAKSQQQTGYLIELWQALLAPLGFKLNTPEEPARRGSHVSLGHREGLRIDLALIHDMNVLPDFRYPDNIRLGIAPLYTSFADIHHAMLAMQQIVSEGLYRNYSTSPPVVT